jgi:hypothetical protein
LSKSDKYVILKKKEKFSFFSILEGYSIMGNKFFSAKMNSQIREKLKTMILDTKDQCERAWHVVGNEAIRQEEAAGGTTGTYEFESDIQTFMDALANVIYRNSKDFAKVKSCQQKIKA